MIFYKQEDGSKDVCNMQDEPTNCAKNMHIEMGQTLVSKVNGKGLRCLIRIVNPPCNKLGMMRMP